jgi:FHS family L-fucose permease-like MFS transporter
MNNSKNYLVPFILVTSLFFLWAFLHNINGILIPHLKKVCQLTDTQSSFIDIAVYFAYFSMALPAGWFMHRYGYRKAILFGLFLFGVGFLLFIPAASTRVYGFFLGALFIGSAGATFLETVANPYVTKLGDTQSATRRLNFAQSFNGVGAVLAPIIGGNFILSGIEHSPETLKSMSQEELNNYLSFEASTVKIPYLILAVVVFLILLAFIFTKLPEFHEKDEKEKSSFSFAVFRHKHFKWAVFAQLCYVGAQVCVASFFIRFSKYTMDLNEKQAALWWGSIAMVGFMVGRFAGTYIMKFIRPEKLLGIYSAINILLLIVAVSASGNLAVYALVTTPFFMSIGFPTIFALGIKGLGEETKIASSFIVMAIVGGAIFPVIMARISDATGGNIQLAYVVPIFCFAFILLFALKYKAIAPVVKEEKIVLTH